MGIDLSKLSPAPWEWKRSETGEFYELLDANGSRVLSDGSACGEYGADITPEDEDAKFLPPARLAFDVMMRRGWGVLPVHGGGWQAVMRREGSVVGVCGMIVADDPYTALIDADHWYRENVECTTC